MLSALKEAFEEQASRFGAPDNKQFEEIAKQIDELAGFGEMGVEQFEVLCRNCPGALARRRVERPRAAVHSPARSAAAALSA